MLRAGIFDLGFDIKIRGSQFTEAVLAFGCVRH